MGNSQRKKLDLTEDQARVKSEDFLWHTKVPERYVFKLVLEYLVNEDQDLTNAKSTLICLYKGGQYFH